MEQSLENYVIGAVALLPILVFLGFALGRVFLTDKIQDKEGADHEAGIYDTPYTQEPLISRDRNRGVDVSILGKHDLLGLLIFVLLYGANVVSYMRREADDELVLDLNILISSALFHGFMVLLVIFLLVWRVRPSVFFGLGNASFGSVLRYAGFGYLTMFGFSIVLGSLKYDKFLEKYFGKVEVQKSVELLRESQDQSIVVAMILIACIVAPLAEEVVFRGYLYPVMKRFSERKFAMVVSSLFFAVVHTNLFSLLPLFLLAMILVYVYEKSGSLWAPIFLHMAFNTTTVLYQLYAKANPEIIPS